MGVILRTGNSQNKNYEKKKIKLIDRTDQFPHISRTVLPCAQLCAGHYGSRVCRPKYMYV